MSTFKIMHISDLHIHGGAAMTNPNHKHSIPHMRGIQKIVERHPDLDRLIITGDISHYGHEENLLLAKQWIYNSLEIGNDIQISLGMKDFNKIKIIPGNHDAWNSKSKHGKTTDRRQKSLENFNFALKRGEKDVIPFPDGYYYDWIEKDDRGILITFLDSSFLGDAQIEKENPNLKFLDAIAKGKISKKQSESVLELFDKGMAGKLPNPENGKAIPAGTFSKSLKVIAMHHYLFEPNGQQIEPLLQMNERNTVFRNFALADTDMLLCGHKHYAENKDHLYLHYFNKRAKARYIFNYFRRLIGINSLPFQYSDKDGKKDSKFFSALISIFLKKYHSQNDNRDILTDDAFLEKITEILLKAIDNPINLEKEIKDFVLKHNHSALDDDQLDDQELMEIVARIKSNLSDEEKEKLKMLTKELKKVIKKLFARQFLQLMAGSACKAHDGEEKFRSFNIYTITSLNDGYQLKCERFIWDSSANDFNDDPQVHMFEFKDRNRPLH